MRLTTGGTVLVDGTAEVDGRQVLVLRALQARDSALVGSIALAGADERSEWLDDLTPVSDPRGLLGFA